MQPPERYKQLCSAAAQSAKQYLERRQRRLRACASASQAIVLFLGIPEERASITELDEAMRETRDQIPIGTEVALPAGRDEFFYFGLNLQFEDSAQAHFGGVTLLIGVDVSGSGYAIKHVKSFEVPDLSEESLRPFAEHVYDALLEHYQTPYSRGRQSIGFVRGDSAA